MGDPKYTITLNEGDSAVLERTAGDRYNVRINGQGYSVTLDRDHPTLTVIGDGKGAEVIIPANASLDPDDFVPRIETDKPNVAVIGGSFIAAKESDHPAVVIATPIGFTNITLKAAKDGTLMASAPENALHINNDEDPRYERDAQTLTYQDVRGNNRTVAIEKDSPGITVVNPADKTEVITLSGKDQGKTAQAYDTLVNDTKKAASAATTGEERKRLGITLIERTEPSPAREAVSPELSRQRQDAIKEATTRLKELSRNPMLARQEGMPALLQQAQDAVTHIMRSDNSIDPTRVKKFHQAMDRLIDKADASHSPAGSILEEKFTEIKTNFGKVDGLKVSLLPSAQEQALAAIHPSLAGQAAAEANHDLKTPRVAFAHVPQSKGPLLG